MKIQSSLNTVVSRLKLNYKWLFIFLIFSAISNLSAQEVSFENFNSMNGLPSNEVYHMYQDENGLLWFATDRGICSYDGYQFRTFGLKDGITSTTIFKFFPQDNGDVWCTTMNNQFFYFNPKDYVFHAYRYNDLLAKVSIDAIAENLFIESNGTIHVSFINVVGEISINSGGKLINRPTTKIKNGKYELNLEKMEDGKLFSYLYDENKTIPRDYHVEHFAFKNDEFYLGYHKDFQYDKLKLVCDQNSVYFFENDKLKKKINTGVQPIGLGLFDDNHFWVGYRYGGLVIYNLEGNPVQSYLDGKSVSRVLFDHEDGIWVSTISHGVFKTPDISFHHYLLEKESHIGQLSVDEDEKLIVSYNNGRVYKKLGDDFEFIKQSHVRVLIHSQYYQTINSQIYVDTKYTDNLLFESKFKKRIFTFAPAIVRLSDESYKPPILCTHFGFGIVKPDLQLTEYLLNGRVDDACMTEDRLFLAMLSGLYHFDTISKTKHKINSKLLNFQIDDVDCFRNNGAIVATRGGGVVFVNKEKIWSITESDGLTNNVVTEVYVQNDSVVWACTNRGLNRISFGKDKGYKISQITQIDGLIDNDVTDVEIIDRTVWVATRSGLCSFPLSFFDDELVRSDYHLKILSKKVNDKLMFDLTNLHYWQNKIEINFQAISFKKNELLKYRYKINGLDDKWTYTTNLIVIYESLPFGEYEFNLQVGIENNWFNEIVKMPIIIYPPFYKTWWFRLMVALGIGSLVFLFFKIRVLSYNRDILKEILRQILKRLRKKSSSFIVSTDGKSIKINSEEVLYVKSFRNYIEIYRENKKAVIVRNKISNFLSLVPDPLEYLQINRSYIIRIDKVTVKSKDTVTINDTEIKVGNTYLKALSQVYF